MPACPVVKLAAGHHAVERGDDEPLEDGPEGPADDLDRVGLEVVDDYIEDIDIEEDDIVGLACML